MVIIGITGTLGAGKGTVVNYLVKNKNFKHFSVRGYLTEELQKNNLEPNRENLVNRGNELRKKFGSNYIALELYKKASETGQNCIIESIRVPDEAKALKYQGEFYLLAVDADIKTRYERIKSRASATDQISFEQFKHDEKSEMTSNDPTRQNLSKCIEMADFLINNDGDLNNLYEQIEKTIKKFK